MSKDNDIKKDDLENEGHEGEGHEGQGHEGAKGAKGVASTVFEGRVKAIIVEQLGVKEEEVTREASFVDDLGADSLDTVELVMAIEEEFEIEVTDEQAEKIHTVGQIYDHISKVINAEVG